MKKTVSYYEFSDWFRQHRPNNFSRAGLLALWEMLENYEDCTGEEIEFDPIAYCCEYTEYGSMEEFWQDYPDEEKYPNSDAIMDYTTVWCFGTESFIIQEF